MIKIIDNFIDQNNQNAIEDYVYSANMPYRLYKIHNYGSGIKSPLQFSHHLYMHEEGTSPHFPMMTPVYESLFKLFNGITLFRAKVNITTPYPPYDKYHSQEPHVDLQYDNGASIDHLVCVYYVNDADGPTIFFTKEYGEHHMHPVKGTAVIFDGSIIHAGSNPLHTPFRSVINIDFKKGVNQTL